MKNNNQILAAIFLVFFFTSGYSETPTLSIFDINGVTVEIPIKRELASDSIPPEISSALEEVRANERRSLYNRQFDLSTMSRPEKDANDVSIDTRKIFLEITNSSSRNHKTMCNQAAVIHHQK